MVGETIKDFKLTRRLGRGGMGEVWEAEQQIIKTKVAIKFLLAEVSSDKQHVQRFFNEAIAVSKIKHAGITKIYDVGFHAERAYLIMELLEGETLAARIMRSGRLTPAQAAEIGRQMASILEATHATGITHRDLKPDNVFLVPDAELASKERVKILDFGIAKLAYGNTGSTGLTATGGSMGTPAYMAPEQWTDAAKADARADIYSLGCVTFEMVCGRPPFAATSIGEACTQHLTALPPHALTIAPHIPAEIDELIARMLAKDPGARPAITDIAAVFAGAAASRPPGLEPTIAPVAAIPAIPASAATAATSSAARSPVLQSTLGSAASSAMSAKPARRGTPLKVLAGVVVVVGVAGAAYLASRNDGAQPPAEAVTPQASTAALAPTTARPASEATSEANPWIAIALPPSPIILGIDDDKVSGDHRGFRPSRKLTSPNAPFSIQRHEVTWGELQTFLANTHAEHDPLPWATAERLPATGITWAQAEAYCESIGASLPTEAEWELAARGKERRRAPWGDSQLDPALTHAFAGPDAKPVDVETSAQDVTPEGVHDLAGNVREWTRDLWIEDTPGHDETYDGATTVRAVRGLQLEVAASARKTVGNDIAAYRDSLCSTGPCADQASKLRVYVGFRCAKQGVEKAKSTSSAKQPASQPVHAAPAQALPTTPASKPTNPPSTTPASVPTSVKTTDGGCDEVSCTVGSTTGPCCDKFEKSARPSAALDGQPGLHGGSGSDLPETLDRMMITTSVAAIAAAAHACGDESPRAKGRVKIRVRVAPSGTVENAEVTEAPSPTLGRCVVKAMQRAQFPKTRSGGFFTHPFTF